MGGREVRDKGTVWKQELGHWWVGLQGLELPAYDYLCLLLQQSLQLEKLCLALFRIRNGCRGKLGGPAFT